MQNKDVVELDVSFPEYLHGLGTVFKVFDRQDSGNISYGVRSDSARIWVKRATTKQATETILNSLALYRDLRHPLIPRHRHALLLADGLAAREVDWVDGDVLNSPETERQRSDSPHSRFLALPVATRIKAVGRIFELFRTIERMGYIIEDFYDGCIIYDFEREHIRVCDLDHAHPGPYRLERSRQYGSSRFMAPEEFVRGSVIDSRTAVFTMGATATVFLGGGEDGKPFAGSNRLRLVVARAVEPIRGKRYACVGDFCKDWRRALEDFESDRGGTPAAGL
jgi:serine/threonine-protein kinase